MLRKFNHSNAANLFLSLSLFIIYNLKCLSSLYTHVMWMMNPKVCFWHDIKFTRHYMILYFIFLSECIMTKYISVLVIWLQCLLFVTGKLWMKLTNCHKFTYIRYLCTVMFSCKHINPVSMQHTSCKRLRHSCLIRIINKSTSGIDWINYAKSGIMNSLQWSLNGFSTKYSNCFKNIATKSCTYVWPNAKRIPYYYTAHVRFSCMCTTKDNDFHIE